MSLCVLLQPIAYTIHSIPRNAPVNDACQALCANSSAEADPQQLATSSNACTGATVGPQLAGASAAAAPHQTYQQDDIDHASTFTSTPDGEEAAPQHLATISNACTEATVGPQPVGASAAVAHHQINEQGDVEDCSTITSDQSSEYDAFTSVRSSGQGTANMPLQTGQPPEDAASCVQHQRNADKHATFLHDLQHMIVYNLEQHMCSAPAADSRAQILPPQDSDPQMPTWRTTPSPPPLAASPPAAISASLRPPSDAPARPLQSVRPPQPAVILNHARCQMQSTAASPSTATMGGAEGMTPKPVLSAVKLAKLEGEREHANQASLGDNGTANAKKGVMKRLATISASKEDDGATTTPTVDVTAAPTVDSIPSSSAAATTSRTSTAITTKTHKRLELASYCTEYR